MKLLEQPIKIGDRVIGKVALQPEGRVLSVRGSTVMVEPNDGSSFQYALLENLMLDPTFQDPKEQSQ